MNRNTLLIADDMKVNRALLSLMFREQFQVVEAENGQEAIDYLDAHGDCVACLLLDLLMPVKDGFEVMEYMKQKQMLLTIPIILITSESTPETEENAYNLGAADVIYKPYVERVVMRRVKNVVDLYTHKNYMEALVKEKTQQIAQQAEEIKESNEQLIEGLGKIIEYHTPASKEHSSRVKTFTGLMMHYAQKMHPELGLTPEDTNAIVRASVLHDIGKLGVPDAILSKNINERTIEDTNILQSHPALGCDILKCFSKINDQKFYHCCYEICKYHHERYDGSGYPNHVAGDSIPLSAQIVAIADTYDKLVIKTAYNVPFTHHAAVQEIMSGNAGSFSPIALECFDLAKEEIYELLQFTPAMTII